MINNQRKNYHDRELFSELIEPPIHPYLVQVVPLFQNEIKVTHFVKSELMQWLVLLPKSWFNLLFVWEAEASWVVCGYHPFKVLIEPPIHPYIVQVVPPFLEESNPMYIIQMSSETAWKWRVFYWLPCRVFDSLQVTLLPLSYKPNESSCNCIGHTVSKNLRRFKCKLDSRLWPQRKLWKGDNHI